MKPSSSRPTLVPLSGGLAAETVGSSTSLAQGRTAELVERARLGDMSAWARLYQDHFDGLYGHVRCLARHDAPVEDLVQEAFARALVALPEFNERSTFSTWLHGIALNVVRNHWRQERNTKTAHQRLTAMTRLHEDQPETGNVHARLVAKNKIEALYEVLETLPEALREAFVLRELKGLSPEAAAEQLHITPGHLCVRASRARTRIREELTRRGWLPSRSAEDT